jgi:hypothetical protein
MAAHRRQHSHCLENPGSLADFGRGWRRIGCTGLDLSDIVISIFWEYFPKYMI